MRRLLLLTALVLATVAGAARADVAPAPGPQLVAPPLLVLEPSGRVTLLARFDGPLPEIADGRPAGRARIDRQGARLRALGRPARACVAAVAARDGGSGRRPRPLHTGRTYTVRILRGREDPDPVVARVVLRAARPGDTRGEALGCA